MPQLPPVNLETRPPEAAPKTSARRNSAPSSTDSKSFKDTLGTARQTKPDRKSDVKPESRSSNSPEPTKPARGAKPAKTADNVTDPEKAKPVKPAVPVPKHAPPDQPPEEQGQTTQHEDAPRKREKDPKSPDAKPAPTAATVRPADTVQLSSNVETLSQSANVATPGTNSPAPAADAVQAAAPSTPSDSPNPLPPNTKALDPKAVAQARDSGAAPSKKQASTGTNLPAATGPNDPDAASDALPIDPATTDQASNAAKPSAQPATATAGTDFQGALQIHHPAGAVVDGSGPNAQKPAAAQLSPEAQFAETNHAKIVSDVRSQLLPGGGSMRIRLDPPELGALHIRVEMQHGVMTASFETSNDQATRLLSHSLGDLKSALEAQGVTVDKLHVRQSNNRQSASGDDRQGEPDRQQEQAARQEQQRKEMLRRMWRRLSNGNDPLDLVA